MSGLRKRRAAVVQQLETGEEQQKAKGAVTNPFRHDTVHPDPEPHAERHEGKKHERRVQVFGAELPDPDVL